MEEKHCEKRKKILIFTSTKNSHSLSFGFYFLPPILNLDLVFFFFSSCSFVNFLTKLVLIIINIIIFDLIYSRCCFVVGVFEAPDCIQM